MISDILTAGVFASMIRLATPYLFASIGEMFGQRSGVFNLGVDGIMLMGAFFSFYAVLSTGSLLLGVLVAIIVGAILGLAMAFVSVTLKAEQGISGIGLYLFGLGMSELLFQKWVGTPQSVDGFPRIHFPVLSDIPVIGEIFFNHNLLVYVAFALVPISAYILNKTSFGLSIRAVGQNPQAADAMGVNVRRVRYTTVTIAAFWRAWPVRPCRLRCLTCSSRTSRVASGSSPWRWCTSGAGDPMACWSARCCSASSTPCSYR